jgi:hypothetical protein
MESASCSVLTRHPSTRWRGGGRPSAVWDELHSRRQAGGEAIDRTSRGGRSGGGELEEGEYNLIYSG